MEIKCPKCKKRYDVDDAYGGQQILTVCPRCGNQFNYTVPEQNVVTAAPVAAPVAIPVAVPVSAPVAAPVSAPVAAPLASAVATAAQQTITATHPETVTTHYCSNCGNLVEDGKAFCPECGASQQNLPASATTETYQGGQVYAAQQPAYGPQRLHNRNKTTAGLLAIFLGGLGAHKFYLGQIVWGIVYLVLCWTYVPAIVAFIEGIMFFTSSEESFDAKYNYQ